MKLAIVLPHYGGADLTWRCLTHLWLFAPEAKLIVVDDASPDKLHTMRPFLESRGVTYLRHEENRGLTVGWNNGVRLAGDADWIGFINNDAAIMPECMVHMVRASGLSPLVCARSVSTGRLFDPSACKQAEGERNLSVGFLSTFFIVERAFGERVKWFDESMKLQFSDTDFSIRCRQQGVEGVVAERAIVYHGGSVCQKRMGIEAATDIYVHDQTAFQRKWAAVPGVGDNQMLTRDRAAVKLAIEDAHGRDEDA